jgi:DNA-binding MarR family transcriptional regulator
VEPTRWLDDEEQAAWRQLVAVILKLPAALERQLQRDAGLSHFEYWVMALLSEAPARTLRMSDLAGQANASLSRLSHVVSRLERHHRVTRRPDPGDARITLATLTDEGFEVVAVAAPGHVAAVRRLVFGGLDRGEVADLERVCAAILGSLDPAPSTEQRSARTRSVSD